MLLDVVRTTNPAELSDGEATDRVAKWPDSSYTGVMRYTKRVNKGGVPEDVLLADLSDVMPKTTEWGDVLTKVETKVTNDQTLVLVEKFRTPLKKLVVG